MITSDKLHGFFPIFPWQNQQQKLDSLISAIGFRRLQPETPAEKKLRSWKIRVNSWLPRVGSRMLAGTSGDRHELTRVWMHGIGRLSVMSVNMYRSFCTEKGSPAECSNLISLAWKKSLNLLSSFRELSSVIPLWNSIASCCFNAWKDAETWKHCTWIHRKLAVLCSEDREQHVLKKKYFRRWEVSPHFNSKHW